MHDGHRPGELGQERRLLDGGVAAADDHDVLVAEEEPVAGGTPGHAVAGEALLVRQAELAVGRAHGQDDRAGPVDGALAVGDGLDRALEGHLGHVVGHQLGAEPLGLGPHVLHQVGAHDAVAEPGVVLHLGGVHQGATGGDGALEDQRLQVGPGGVDGGGVAGRSRADDDDVADVGAHAWCPLTVGSGRSRDRRTGGPGMPLLQPILGRDCSCAALRRRAHRRAARPGCRSSTTARRRRRCVSTR